MAVRPCGTAARARSARRAVAGSGRAVAPSRTGRGSRPTQHLRRRVAGTGSRRSGGRRYRADGRLTDPGVGADRRAGGPQDGSGGGFGDAEVPADRAAEDAVLPGTEDGHRVAHEGAPHGVDRQLGTASRRVAPAVATSAVPRAVRSPAPTRSTTEEDGAGTSST
ncbi:hypothetical protein Shyhy01_47180 [Streptomyces hygroscopicus subsp. hygroscopicus]|nr:hypothetical protein Shyhy01_47180 [Streptomyces hygroscopicus subsp. hygroscopicus]